MLCQHRCEIIRLLRKVEKETWSTGVDLQMLLKALCQTTVTKVKHEPSRSTFKPKSTRSPETTTKNGEDYNWANRILLKKTLTYGWTGKSGPWFRFCHTTVLKVKNYPSHSTLHIIMIYSIVTTRDFHGSFSGLVLVSSESSPTLMIASSVHWRE